MNWRSVGVLLCVAALGLLLWMAPQLPDPMASKFSLDGTATRWSSRAVFLITVVAVTGLLNVLFLGGIPRLLRNAPTPRFSVPNRRYWLATPERRRDALGRLDRYLCKSSVFANALILLSLHLVAQGNDVPVLFEIPPDVIGPLLVGTVLGGVLVLALWAQSDFAIPAGAQAPSGDAQSA